MPVEEDPMMALVESWDTYLVPPTTTPASAPQRRGPPAVFEPSAWRYHLTDAFPIFAPDELRGLSAGDRAASAAANLGLPSSASSSSSLLWLLTLVSHNVELLRAAAHLVLQFNAQFAALVAANEAAVGELRTRHQNQLDSLLEVADSHAGAEMIVDTTVTERVVLQQQDELDALERRHAAAELQLEAELRETFWAFLSTSAPDAVAAANRKEHALGWADGGDASGGLGSLYRAEVDVSRFAEVRKPVPANSRRSNSAVAPFSPVRMVPVRTIKLSNKVGDALTAASAAAAASTVSSAAQRAKSARRSQDATLQPIILDVSPISGLARCVGCCTGTLPGSIASSVSSAAEEHLLRLAHTRHSVLLFIGAESAAMDVLQSCRAPELLLGAAHSCQDRFQPLPSHPLLRVLFTTRLWGANIVLLWSSAQEGASAGAAGSAAAAQTVVEDALELAYAWDADMFSVAVLEGARLPHYALAAGGGGAGSASPAFSAASSAASASAAFLASQAVSMEVLRQLRNGVTRELLDTAGTRRTRRWQGTATWMQQGIGSGGAATAGSHMCPRAVGVLYSSQNAVPPRQPSPPGRHTAASPLRENASITSVSSSSLLAPLSPPASPITAFRGPSVTFNTPMAIRAFLPLAEEYFVRGRPDTAVGSPSADEAASPLGASLHRDHGSSHGGLRRSPSRSGVDGEDDDNSSFNSDTEPRFSHSSFTRTSPHASSAALDAMGASHADRAAGLVRQRETMSLESLIQYAFGEFAETL